MVLDLFDLPLLLVVLLPQWLDAFLTLPLLRQRGLLPFLVGGRFDHLHGRGHGLDEKLPCDGLCLLNCIVEVLAFHMPKLDAGS